MTGVGTTTVPADVNGEGVRVGGRVSRRATLAAYCAWIVLLGLAYFALPTVTQPLVGAVMGLGAVAAIVLGVWFNRPARAGAWLLLAAAVVARLIGWAVYELLPGPDATMKRGMYLVELFAVAKFALVLAGLLALSRRRRRRVDATAVIDATILVLGVGLLVWVGLILPLGADEAVRRAGHVIASGYPLGDALILVATAMFLTVVRRSPSAAMLAAGVLALVVYDVMLLAAYLGGTWLRGTPADLWWMAGYGVIGVAALHRSMASVAPPAARPYGTSTARFGLLALASLIPSAILLEETLRGETGHGSWIVFTSATMLLLVLARLSGAAHRLRQQSTREQSLRTATADLVGAADADEVTAALNTAVRRLLPAGTPYRLVLATAESGLGSVEHGVAEPGVMDPAALPDPIATRLPGVRRALAYPLEKEGPGEEAAPSGLVVVGADDAALATLRVPLATLAAAATLALERVRLSRKVIQSASEEYFRALIQNAADIILVLDDDDRVRYASPSAVTIFGDRDLSGLPLSDLIDNRDEAPPRRSAVPPRGRANCTAWAPAGASWATRDGAGRPAVLDVACRDLRGDPSIRGRVMTLRDVTEQRRLERELTWQAFHDPLTGLPNRLLFARRVQEAVATGVSAGRVTGVLLIDLDEFKLVNDALGHEAGDEYLTAVGRRLVDVLAPHGLAARLGGDEFAALVANAPDAAAVDEVAAGLVEAVGRPVPLDGQVVACGASVGVATTAEPVNSQELMHRADLSLYAAKQAGKGRWRHFEPAMHSAVVHRLELRSSLEAALREDQFALEFQPIVRLGSGEVVGYEALLRWDHPSRGRLVPAEFLDVAEESGLIVPIGDWVLGGVVQAAATWRSVAPEKPRYVSVNVSARQFQAPGFVDSVSRALAACELAPGGLMLEITEGLLLRDDERVWGQLEQLRTTGVRLAIDDFGTGYSALSYLRQVPLDTVKIDRRFTSSIACPRQQRSVFEGVVNLARALDLAVVAEGIETPAQQSDAVRAGCAFGQGFLFAHPMPGADVLRELTADRHPVGRPQRQPVPTHVRDQGVGLRHAGGR